MTPSVAALYDACRFDLGYRHRFHLPRPGIFIGKPVIGTAFTTVGRPVHDEQEAAAADDIRLQLLSDMASVPNPIQVVGGEGSDAAAPALYGDISALLAKRAGAVGALVAGPSRDIDRIEKTDFTLACDSASPQDAYGLWAIREFQIPVEVHGVTVHPEDMIAMDTDGIVVVRLKDAEQARDLALKREENEEVIRTLVREGRSPLTIKKELGRW